MLLFYHFQFLIGYVRILMNILHKFKFKKMLFEDSYEFNVFFQYKI